MNATGKRRLLKLADFLHDLPRSKRFSMATFAGSVKDGRPECGTDACAAGYAACIPSFRRAGYALVRRRGNEIEPKFKRSFGFDAIRRFFDLNERESFELFGWFNPTTGMWNPNSPTKTAQRIRRLVKHAA
jgi:hypothetical protein